MQESIISPAQGQGGEETTAPQGVSSNQTPRLVSVRDLIGSSFSLYKQYFWRLIGVQFIQVFVIMGVGALTAFSLVALSLMGSPTAVLWIVIPVILVAGLVIAMVSLAMIYIFHSGMSVGKALGSAFKNIFSYSWVAIVAYLAIMGGTLLLIIPGIVFAVWFAFAIYVFVVEGRKGFGAMMTSKEYIRGYWWDVLGRFLVLALLGAAFQMLALLIVLAGGESLQRLVGALVNLVFTPFVFIYIYLIYKNLKELKPQVASSPAPEEKKGFFVAAAILGLVAIIIPLILVTSLYPKLGKAPSDFKYSGLEGLNVPQ